MNNCIFCEIVKDNIKSFMIGKNDSFIAILDISPSADGHSVIIPKKHFKKISEFKKEDVVLLWELLNNVTDLLRKKLNAEGFTIGINNGKVAGQELEHFHLHIIPRYTGDGGGSLNSVVNVSQKESVKSVYNKIISL